MNEHVNLSATGNERIVPGGNNPPTPFDDITSEIEDLYAEAKNWADGEPIDTQAQCDALDVLDKALLKAGQELDALRVEEKRPLDEQIKAIQDRYNPFIQPKKGKVDMARSALNPLRSDFKAMLAREKAEAAEKARREREEADAKAREAMQASAGDLAAREEAEWLAAQAKIAAADEKRMTRAATTGNGLRTYYDAEVTDFTAAARHYWETDRDRFAALVQELADRDVRAGKRSIPGINVIERKVAV